MSDDPVAKYGKNGLVPIMLFILDPQGPTIDAQLKGAPCPELPWRYEVSKN